MWVKSRPPSNSTTGINQVFVCMNFRIFYPNTITKNPNHLKAWLCTLDTVFYTFH